MNPSKKFLPIIVGTDINAYNMAISFHEHYQIQPVLVGRDQLSFTELSTIPRAIEIDQELGESKRFVSFLQEIANKYRNEAEQLLLVGTNDLYVRLIIENQAVLRQDYVFNYIQEDLMNQLLVKKNFYATCEAHGIDIPSTHFVPCTATTTFKEEVTFPVIIKPSNGVLYYKNPFPNMQKVYKVESYDEVNEVISTIANSGYTDDLIIQEYIPGDDTYMYDSVVYINQRGKTEIVTFAQVVLQEQTVTAIGNYTALVTKYNEELMLKLKGFLEDLGYVGFANFDMKYDYRDGKYKLFEVNIRQGRSSYYLTSCGYNMAKFLVDDCIEQRNKPLVLLKEDHLFTVVPKYVLKRFVVNQEVKQEVKRLLKEKKYRNPLFYKKDKSFKRKIYLFLRQINYVKKYKNNSWQE